MTSIVSRAADPAPEELVASVGLAPERCASSRAAALVEQNGAATLTGGHGDPRELVVAAAEVLGTRLRTVFPVRQKTEHSAEPLDLHSDGADVVVDVHDRAVRLRVTPTRTTCSSSAGRPQRPAETRSSSTTTGCSNGCESVDLSCTRS